jgi:hypothetical protein
MTDLYHSTKVVAAAKDWRDTDKAKIAAPAADKDRARSKHRLNEQKLRAAVDELAPKAGGRP